MGLLSIGVANVELTLQPTRFRWELEKLSEGWTCEHDRRGELTQAGRGVALDRQARGRAQAKAAVARAKAVSGLAKRFWKLEMTLVQMAEITGRMHCSNFVTRAGPANGGAGAVCPQLEQKSGG